MPRRRRSSRTSRSGLLGLLPALPRLLPAVPRVPALARLLPAVPRLPAPRPARAVRAGVARKRPVRRAGGPGRWVQRTHGGRSYDVYLPAGLRAGIRAPLLVLLHGCNQTAVEFAAATRFTATADRNGFVIASPHQGRRYHPNRCWRWYEAAHQQRGAGEPAVLVGIVERVIAENARWRIDPRRVYVAGLSAGGAMALILAATYPDVFAAAGVHSAPAYRSATRATQALPAMAGQGTVPPPVPGAVSAMVPTIVVQGGSDHVVRPSNGDRVADQWLMFRRAAAAAGPDPGRIARTRTSTGRSPDGRRYTTVRWYSTRGRKVLEYWRIEGLGHAWSGGRDGGSYSDPAGPRAATLMWQFFRSQLLTGPTGRSR